MQYLNKKFNVFSACVKAYAMVRLGQAKLRAENDKLIDLAECMEKVGAVLPAKQVFIKEKPQDEEHKKILDRQFWNIEYYNKAREEDILFITKVLDKDILKSTIYGATEYGITEEEAENISTAIRQRLLNQKEEDNG